MLGLGWLRERRRRRARRAMCLHGQLLTLRAPIVRRPVTVDLAPTSRLSFFACDDGFGGRARGLQFWSESGLVAGVSMADADAFALLLELVTEVEARRVESADASAAAGGRDEDVELDLGAFLARLRECTRRGTAAAG